MSRKTSGKTRILLFIIATIGIVAFISCNKSKEASVSLPVEQTQTQVEQTQTEEQTDVAKTEKVLIVTGEYVPYVGQTLEKQGFITEMIETALNDAGIDYKIEFYPWARCSEMVQSGEAWAAYPYGHSEQNDKSYLFSDTIFSTRHKFYYLKENERISEEVKSFSDLSDFTDYVFGGASGYWYGTAENFTKLGVQVEWAGDTDALIKMLYAKRIDFFIEDELVCEEAIKRIFPGEEEKFAILEANAKEQDYYMITSPDYPDTEELLQRFNNAIK